MEEPTGEVVRRRHVKRRVALALLILLLIGLLILWVERRPIAADFIDRELARRGVQARYDVKKIGFRTERLENLVIGDPRAPDLTARSVEVRLSWGLRRPTVTLITARGVRLYGRVVGGKVKLGQIDRLLPPPTGLPFSFPDQAVDLADAAIRLDTPAGRIGLAVEGKGNLANGFRGEVAAMSAGLALGDCRITRPRARWRVAIDALRPSLSGPVSAGSLACGRDLLVTAPNLRVQATLAQALDGWRGAADIRAAAARVSGNSLGGMSGRFSFDGNADRTWGSLLLAAAAARLGSIAAARTAVEGRYAISLKTGALALQGDGSASGISAGGTVRPLAAALASAGGTPIEPIGDSLAASLRRAAGAFDALGSFRLVNGRGFGGVRFDRLRLASRSGARLALGGGQGLTYYWSGGRTRLGGDVLVEGDGFPRIALSLDQPGVGKPVSGVARVAAMAAGGARLQLSAIRFTAGGGGATRIDTAALLDGPLGDGRVEGLFVPISGRLDDRGGFAFGDGCVAARFDMLRFGSLRLGRTRLPLCPTGRALVWKAPGGRVTGGAELRAPRFAGTLGQSPLALAASRIAFSLQGPDFTGSDVAVQLGRGDAASRIRMATLTGRFDGPGVRGRYAGLAGKLANVPLLLSEGAGEWQVRRGDLLMTGGLRVADEADPPRFYPLVSRDFRLTLADNQIRAGGHLDDPETGTRVLEATIRHALRTGAGGAVLDVPGIRFDDNYQPEQLTRLTTGIVALVKGVVKGRGEIAWGPEGARSSGSFGTENMDFAAAFGPVEGVSTTAHFTDLLGLVTAPGQVAQVGVVRTGIDVFDGHIRYQLLPNLNVRVEGGRWPFAGGELILDETVLDFAKPTAKRLTFRVVGLDAAIFIEQMKFSNIAATGTFDGVIPMVFDEAGGRIEGGRLIARQQGGTLSYVGAVTEENLGAYGKLAFDALKSLRYSKLAINLDGSLAGEFVAAIELDGIARNPTMTALPGSGIQGMVARRALGQLAKIPLEFNINVRGPFRALIGTMRSFDDPSLLIQDILEKELLKRPSNTVVQPHESEKVQ